MDTMAGYSEVVFGYAASPNTRTYLPGNLPAAGYASEPSGDAGEGVDLLSHLGVEQKGRFEPEDFGVPVNHDSGFTPLPGVLPGEKHLNYARTFTVTSLLAIGIVFLLFKVARDPSGAVRLVGEGAKRQAGVK